MGLDTRFPFVRSVRWLEEVDSTNELARRMLATETLETPALIWADRQTRGRGQRSNSWWSDAGSLTATVVLDPRAIGLTLAQESKAALTVASVVVDAIKSLYLDCRPGIRWPNDIEILGRKLGGILPERVETCDGPRLLIGIGLNVRTSLENAPSEVNRMAATLTDWAEIVPSTAPIPDLLAVILERLADALAVLVRDGTDLVEVWNHLDTLTGAAVRVEVGSSVIEGVGAGIDDSGGLRIVRDGEVRIIHAGRVLRD